ncbi:coniferyl alcohol acyltransferase-like [Bidens hawaiensis]|uniref:coniferyl alcohol acyltransferase-like n=1 Tax=Bidens hawaiensis TaxID=980011 RepID=UPI00404B1AFF
MGIGDDSFLVKVIENEVVHAKEPWVDHWLPFTNFDLLVPPSDIGSIFFYKKPSHENFPTIVNTLKASLSRALTLYPPLAGEIAWNEAAGENQIHCNNRGICFIEAFADVVLKELDLYRPDECIEGKLMPKKLQHGALGIQVTKLKCDGIVIGVMVDHRIVDGYSANMFISTWADMTRSKTPSMIPSYGSSHLKPRSPTFYSPLIDNVFAPFLPPPSHPDNDIGIDDKYRLVNRVYYIEGEQLNKLQLLANENGCRRSKLVAFTSFLWKSVALSMENSGKQNQSCNVIIAVDGRRRLSEEEDKEKQKLMVSHFGNVLSMPYGSKTPEELKEMSLCNVATEVQEFLKPATTKEHFLDIIDWVEEQKPRPLISKASVGEEITSFTVSAGQRFETMDEIDFGWGKVTFGSCHVPSSRKDSFVMTMGSPKNNEDWVVYMRMPLKYTIFIEEHASHVFKPFDTDYIQI